MTYYDEDDEDERLEEDEGGSRVSGRRAIHDRELPDASDMDDTDDDGGASATVACPWCRASVYEAAERCPKCGRYLSDEDAPRRYPWWLIAGVILCLIVILLFWIR